MASSHDFDWVWRTTKSVMGNVAAILLMPAVILSGMAHVLFMGARIGMKAAWIVAAGTVSAGAAGVVGTAYLIVRVVGIL